MSQNDACNRTPDNPVIAETLRARPTTTRPTDFSLTRCPAEEKGEEAGGRWHRPPSSLNDISPSLRPSCSCCYGPEIEKGFFDQKLPRTKYSADIAFQRLRETVRAIVGYKRAKDERIMEGEECRRNKRKRTR